MKEIAVLSADWHLDEVGRGAWRRRPKLVGDSWYALSQIIDLCLARKLPLLGAGDLLDTAIQEGPSAVQFASEQFDRLARGSGRGVLFIRGNHDMNQGAPWLSLAEAHSVDRQKFMLGDTGCYGLDYTRPGEIHEALAQIPKDTVLLMAHQAWTDWMGEERSHGCKFADVPHARFLLTGDYHQAMIRSVQGASGQQLTVCSPGATNLRSVAEPEQHSVLILRDDLTTIPLLMNSRPVLRRRVDDEEGLILLLRELTSAIDYRDNSPELPEELKTPILDITCSTTLDDAYKRINEVVGDQYHLFFRTVADMYTEVPAKKTGGVYRGQLVDNLGKMLPEGTPENLVAGRLLDLPATEQRNELKRLMQTYLDNGEIVPSASRLTT